MRSHESAALSGCTQLLRQQNVYQLCRYARRRLIDPPQYEINKVWMFNTITIRSLFWQRFFSFLALWSWLFFALRKVIYKFPDGMRILELLHFKTCTSSNLSSKTMKLYNCLATACQSSKGALIKQNINWSWFNKLVHPLTISGVVPSRLLTGTENFLTVLLVSIATFCASVGLGRSGLFKRLKYR